MEIERYDTYKEGMSCKCEVGKFVLYEDHLAIVEKLKEEIEEAYERGFFNGACTGYGQC
jgi:hypothetical protein